jgi:hypothetical protein
MTRFISRVTNNYVLVALALKHDYFARGFIKQFNTTPQT